MIITSHNTMNLTVVLLSMFGDGHYSTRKRVTRTNLSAVCFQILIVFKRTSYSVRCWHKIQTQHKHKQNLSLFIQNNVRFVQSHSVCSFNHTVMSSGVFKGRRGRHLSLGPPVRCYALKFSLSLMKNLLFTHIMYYKADHK